VRKCVLHSLIGDDLYGDLVMARVHESGVSLSAPRVGGQGVCICLSGQRDRAFVSYKGSVGRFCERDINVKQLLSSGTAHVHFAAYYDCVGLQPAVPELMVRAKREGATVSIVPQSDPAGEWRDELLQLLPSVDVLLCNQAEAIAMARVASQGRRPSQAALDEAIASLLEQGATLVVVTLGSEGAIAATSSHRWRQPSSSCEVVDTTGAGDAFVAGFLYGWCGTGDVSRGLMYGCACGGAAVAQMGGSTRLLPSAINRCLPALSRDVTAQRRSSVAGYVRDLGQRWPGKTRLLRGLMSRK